MLGEETTFFAVLVDENLLLQVVSEAAKNEDLVRLFDLLSAN